MQRAFDMPPVEIPVAQRRARMCAKRRCHIDAIGRVIDRQTPRPKADGRDITRLLRRYTDQIGPVGHPPAATACDRPRRMARRISRCALR